jgi:hypothetical protein
MINHKNKLLELGFSMIHSFFDNQFVNHVNQSLTKSYDLCRDIQIKNGIDAVTDGTVHHLIASNEMVYIELINKICQSEIFDFIKDYFQGNFILNSYGGVINIPNKPSYVTNIHRDIRFFSGEFPLMLNLLIMLDDFTLENGATYLLAGSHKIGNKPTDQEFYQKADRALGKRGDVLLFNSNLWHAAGINKTDQERRAITITLTKPFMKQQLDYPRAIGYDKLETMSPKLQQVIGFFCRTPSNLDEWYQKPENRFYRPGQD